MEPWGGSEALKPNELLFCLFVVVFFFSFKLVYLQNDLSMGDG